MLAPEPKMDVPFVISHDRNGNLDPLKIRVGKILSPAKFTVAKRVTLIILLFGQ